MAERNRDVESLEELEERAARAEARGDEEARLDELIDAMVRSEPQAAAEGRPQGEGPREFVCVSCHLVMPRACLADEERLLCADCVREAAYRPALPGGYRARHRTVERPCPACGRTLMVPDREDAACGFFCPGCGVHLRQRGGHLHMEWDHAYHPERWSPSHRSGLPAGVPGSDRKEGGAR